MSNVKERPIIFSGSMARAILGGSKTQTRRVMKPQPEIYHRDARITQWSWVSKDPRTPVYWQVDADHNSKWWDFWDAGYSPYGDPGDRLWVRETWRKYNRFEECACYDDCHCPATGTVIYRADSDSTEGEWRPSIFMPHRASRLTLEIVSVRVERLQDISEEDAWAEGFPDPDGANRNYPDMARYWYKNLWESINGPGSWEANPWVWVVEFKKIEETK